MHRRRGPLLIAAHGALFLIARIWENLNALPVSCFLGRPCDASPCHELECLTERFAKLADTVPQRECGLLSCDVLSDVQFHRMRAFRPSRLHIAFMTRLATAEMSKTGAGIQRSLRSGRRNTAVEHGRPPSVFACFRSYSRMLPSRTGEEFRHSFVAKPRQDSKCCKHVILSELRQCVMPEEVTYDVRIITCR